MDRRRKAVIVELLAAVIVAAVGISSATASPTAPVSTGAKDTTPTPSPSVTPSSSAATTSPASTAPPTTAVPTTAAPTTTAPSSAAPTSTAPTSSAPAAPPLPDGLPAGTSKWTPKPFPKAVAGAPLSAGAVLASLTLRGATVTDYSTTSTLQAARITLLAPDSPPAWPGTLPTVTTSSPTSGWIVWPLTGTVTGTVIFGHGCCEVPTDLGQQAANVATPSRGFVVAMDYRDATSYAPDVASEDLAAGGALVKAALTSLKTTIAYGVSEGGAATALMIEHHPGLADRWVDQSGPIDLYLSTHQLYADLAPLAQNADPDGVQGLINLIAAAVAPGIDPTRLAAVSPIQHVSLLAGLKEVVILHGTGDEVVPYSGSAALAGILDSMHVPVTLTELIPANGQPAESTGWHVPTQIINDGAQVVARMLGSATIASGLHATIEEGAIG